MRKILTFGFVLAMTSAAQAQAVSPLIAAIQTLRPGAQFNIVGDTCAGLQWTDAVQVKPTCAEISAQISAQAAADSAAAAKVTALKGDATRSALLAKLQGATPAQIKAYVAGLGIADPAVVTLLTQILLVLSLNAPN